MESIYTLFVNTVFYTVTGELIDMILHDQFTYFAPWRPELLHLQ